MKTTILFVALSIISGALIPVQAALNASLTRTIGNPVMTGLTVFSSGLLIMLLYAMATRASVPSLEQFRSAPLHEYAGGLIVAFYVIVITIVTPRLGVGAAIGLIITGQIVSAIAIDHFGLFHVAIKSIDLKRLMGALLMVVGIFLVMKK